MREFKIAFKFLTNNKLQFALITFAISLGIAIQVFIGILISSLQTNLLETTIGSAPHITITKNEAKESFKKPDININYSELSYSYDYPIIIENNSYLIKYVSDSFYNFYNIENYELKNDEIVIGKNIAEDNNISLNDEVRVRGDMLKVVGIADFKVDALNNLWLIKSLDNADTDNITSLELRVEDPFDAKEEADKIEGEFLVTNWMDEQADLLSGLMGQSISSYIIQVFVVLSVVIGITSTLTITVLQKQKQIGILKALGMNDKSSFKIFIYQGLIFGVIGGMLGIAIGSFLLFGFNTFALNSSGEPVVPIIMSYSFILISFIIAVISAVAASYFPSIKTKKLSPMEVIRGE